MREVTVLVEPLAREKILTFAKAVDTEIGGLMSVKQQGRTLTVSDAWTVPQEVSMGGVYFEVGHFEDHIKAMGWANGKAMPHICMGTWHSHGDGGVFWSQVDENDLSRKYAMRGFLVNVVVNHKGEWHSEVNSMVGPENGKPDDYVLVTVPSELKLVAACDPVILAQVTAEIKANITPRKIVMAQGGGRFPGYGPWGDEEGWNKSKNTFWRGHQPQDPHEEVLTPSKRSNRKLFAKARAKDPILGGVWSINKRTKCMEKWVGGNLVAIIDNMGDGALTLYDDKGNTLMTEKNYGRKGWQPPAEL